MIAHRKNAFLLTLLATAWAGGAIAQSPAVDPFLAAARLAQRPVSNGVGQGGVQLTSGYAPVEYAPVEYAPVDYGQPTPYLGPEVGAPNANWGYANPTGGWGWELMPDGLIYRSYQAGPRESRLGLHTIQNSYPGTKSEIAWDATLGGRKGVVRFGNCDPTNPVGWQLDLEGATIVRLNLDENRDVDSSDFRFGVPLTYTAGDGVAYKLGYYHLSSHLGDELIARTGVNNRVNYVRDAIIAGVSYQIVPSVRIYGETAYAFFTAGGAEPWEFQFGAEYSQPGPTGFAGTPFIATNAHLREELEFGGDWTLQTGWLWRGNTGSTLRLGLHYMNGKSTQYQFFDRNEEQFGLGLWCDF
ncbi:hypothetical protein Pla108_34680 [Botrimarina colliarenosi]|uniref:DUF1207 domain-containing protein n=1 Tax=Botrimarina colliarenosi TaxID=2528001 RepID=A0A5C6A5R1_9BACT|nr:DUF1207 domain-containing protein [Botrimarina colliarenosi]TWT95322.1 hypothetical protein Pla108_34680 [Botrimarina colliarenosi]